MKMKMKMISMPLQLQLRLLLLVPLFCVSFARNLANEMATLDGTDTNNNITSYRNNYCQRAQEVEQSNGTIELKDALQGFALSVGTLAPPPPLFLYDVTTGLNLTYPGVNVRVMDLHRGTGEFYLAEYVWYY